MEEQRKSLAAHASKYGALLGGLLVLFSLLMYILNTSFDSPLLMLEYLFYIGILIWGIKSFREQSGGYIRYGRALGTGVLISLFASVVLAFYTYIYTKYIDPGYLDKMFMFMQEKYAQKGVPDDRAEEMIDMMGKFMGPGFMAFSAILNAVFRGTIISLIVSIFLKKEDKSFPSVFGAEEQKPEDTNKEI